MFPKRSILIFLLVTNNILSGAGVTYGFSGGRFGDNLLAYLHAKWISFVYNIPLFYKPFPYSDQLVLHKKEKNIETNRFKKKIILSKKKTVIKQKRNWLYEVPYFSEVAYEHTLPCNSNWLYFDVNWNNKQFYDEIGELIKPVSNSLTIIKPPQGVTSVAVHVRKGGGFDAPLLTDTLNFQKTAIYADFHFSLKFPPEDFYIDQIKKISELSNNKPLYLYIFTDDSNPEALVQRFKQKLITYSNLEFDYRRTNNHHDVNVLEDFFSMIQFDCLIRPQSNFSLVAAKIANYKFEIYPEEHHWEGTKSIIDTVIVKEQRSFNDKKRYIRK